MASTGAIANPYRYGGKYGYYHEPRLNLQLATFRWFAPKLGRWASRDPIGYKGGVNLYGYVGNSPIMFVDPLGFWSLLNLIITGDGDSSDAMKDLALDGIIDGLDVTGEAAIEAGSFGWIEARSEIAKRQEFASIMTLLNISRDCAGQVVTARTLAALGNTKTLSKFFNKQRWFRIGNGYIKPRFGKTGGNVPRISIGPNRQELSDWWKTNKHIDLRVPLIDK
ncbi:hypothetical protein JNK13_04180 [bacterium]|nr:hypothetical protein [bacterium]